MKAGRRARVRGDKPGKIDLQIVGISAVLIVKDAEAFVARALRSLSAFAEVIVYDTGSRDGSMAVAKQFANVRVHEGYFDSFSAARKRAGTLAGNDWIFFIDADEICCADLVGKLSRWNPKTDLEVGCFRLVNIFLGRRMRFGSMRPRIKKRLYNRKKVDFGTLLVHESLQALNPQDKIVESRLQGRINHVMHGSMTELLAKSRFYCKLRADEMPTALPAPLACCKAFAVFMIAYFLRLGLLEGWHGIADAWLAARAVFCKHAFARDIIRAKSVAAAEVKCPSGRRRSH